jgi:antitoxin HicB
MSEKTYSESAPGLGPSVDEWLDEEGIREEVDAGAVKRVIAWQLAQEMKARGMTKEALAKSLHTSRTQVSRLLDPNNNQVQLSSLMSAAAALGRKLRVELT